MSNIYSNKSNMTKYCIHFLIKIEKNVYNVTITKYIQLITFIKTAFRLSTFLLKIQALQNGIMCSLLFTMLAIHFYGIKY